MKLYYKRGACSLAPHIALEEVEAAYQLIEVDFKTKKCETGENYLAINGKGYVPALECHDGTVLTEGIAVLLYIADLNPAIELAPSPRTPAHYQLIDWMTFIATELQKNMASMYNPAQTAELRANVEAVLNKRLDWVASALGNKLWLMGNTYTLADIYLFNILSWNAYVNFSLDNWPALGAFCARVAERPAVIRALESEGLV